jgi:hypothetical protein
LHRLLAAGPADEAAAKKPKGEIDKKLFGTLPGFDFVVTLQGDLLSRAGVHDGVEDGLRLALGLIDHELSHCGQKIGGTFVTQAELATFVKNLRDRHEETCLDVKDPDGRILVRERMIDEDGRPIFVSRDHDVEEFAGVVARWGKWCRQVGQLVDCVIEHDRQGQLPLKAAAE